MSLKGMDLKSSPVPNYQTGWGPAQNVVIYGTVEELHIGDEVTVSYGQHYQPQRDIDNYVPAPVSYRFEERAVQLPAQVKEWLSSFDRAHRANESFAQLGVDASIAFRFSRTPLGPQLLTGVRVACVGVPRRPTVKADPSPFSGSWRLGTIVARSPDDSGLARAEPWARWRCVFPGCPSLTAITLAPENRCRHPEQLGPLLVGEFYWFLVPSS
jgi:hypothetical protein